MAESSVYDQVRSSIAAEDQWIADGIAVTQEVLQALQTARRPLAVEDLWTTLHSIRKRFDEKRLVIAVSGLTSSGKSSLLNALLGFDFLFTAPDHCTPCSVSIERSPNSAESFFKDSRKSKSPKRDIAELATLTDAKSEAPSDRPLFAFLSAEQCNSGILRAGQRLRLVDSPGIHEDSFRENSDLDADALAFVVDLCSGTRWEDLAKVMGMAGLKTKPVLVVFSKIDLVQCHDQRRYEIEREKRFKEAESFLEANKKATQQAIFFLAPKAAVTKRRYDAEVQALKSAILKARKGRTGQEIALLIGSQWSGKSTLCADLIADRTPTCGGMGTPCFIIYTGVEQASQVRFQRLSEQDSGFNNIAALNSLSLDTVPDGRNENLHIQESFSIYEKEQPSIAEEMERTINVATNSNNSSNRIHIRLSKSDLPFASLLLDDFSVVDTPPLEDFEAPLTNSNTSAVVIVVDSQKSPKEMRNSIKACLRIAGVTSDTRVFLAVTKWKTSDEQQAKLEERKQSIQQIFNDCLQSLQLPSSETRNVFFFESATLMREYEASFAGFEERLIKAAHDEFAAFKLEAIKTSVRNLLAEIQSRMEQKVCILKATEDFFNYFANSISDKFLTDTNETVHLRRTTRASRFLSPSRQLPDSELHMKEFFSEFLKYYQEDVTKEILQLSQNALERLKDVDPEAIQNVEKFHDNEMKAIVKQLDLKKSKVGDAYCLSNMLDAFMALIPKPVDEERSRVDELKRSGDKLILLLSTLKNKQLLTTSEMERLQRKWEKLMAVDTSTDEALITDYAERLRAFREELEAMKPQMEERNRMWKITLTRADETYQDCAEWISVIEVHIRQMKVDLETRIDHLDAVRQNAFLRFMNFLYSNRLSAEREAACMVTNEEIKANYEHRERFREDAERAMLEAEELELDAKRCQAEFNSLDEKRKTVEADMHKISKRVTDAQEKMKEDKRRIVEKKKKVDDVLNQQRSKIQETEENLMKHKSDILLAEEKFLEKKNRWDTMKREYYQKLLAELENMSNMLLSEILSDLHHRTQQFASAEIGKLREEKESILALQMKVTCKLLTE